MRFERGWYYLADLNPRRGTEPGKTRPVLVVQTDLLNEHGHLSTLVIPITTNKVEAPELRVRVSAGDPGFQRECDLMVDQLRAIDNRRMLCKDGSAPLKRIAQADSAVMAEVEFRLKHILDLP